MKALIGGVLCFSQKARRHFADVKVIFCTENHFHCFTLKPIFKVQVQLSVKTPYFVALNVKMHVGGVSHKKWAKTIRAEREPSFR